MICPNCNSIMKKSYCYKCGYMKNGNNIKTEDNENQFDQIKVYTGDEYDKILRNESKLIIFILGPLYFSYRKLFLTGIIFSLLDIFIGLFFAYIFQNGPIYFYFPILVNRIFYISFANLIYLEIVKFKLNRLARRNIKKYYMKLQYHSPKSIMLPILTILLFISIILISLFIYKLQ